MEGIRSTIPIFIFSSLRDLRGCSFSSSRLDFSLFRVRIRWGETAVHDALAHLLASSSSQARLPLSGTAVHLARANSFVSLFSTLFPGRLYNTYDKYLRYINVLCVYRYPEEKLLTLFHGVCTDDVSLSGPRRLLRRMARRRRRCGARVR
jgi:hypothetical protein